MTPRELARWLATVGAAGFILGGGTRHYSCHRHSGPKPYKSIEPGKYIAENLRYDGGRFSATGDPKAGHIEFTLKERTRTGVGGDIVEEKVFIMNDGWSAERMKKTKSMIEENDGEIEILSYPLKFEGKIILPPDKFELDESGY